MRHVLALFLLAVISWYAPKTWTNGELISWEAAADLAYLPCYSSYQAGPWTDLPATAMLWANAPPPPAGSTYYYSCRAMYCPGYICEEPSGYATPVSLAVEPYIPPIPPPPPPPKKGWGKGGKQK